MDAAGQGDGDFALYGGGGIGTARIDHHHMACEISANCLHAQRRLRSSLGIKYGLMLEAIFSNAILKKDWLIQAGQANFDLPEAFTKGKKMRIRLKRQTK